MANYYILDEQQYYGFMSVLMIANRDFGGLLSTNISEATFCGKPIKKAELHPYSIFFEETKDPDTGETIITGRAAVSGTTVISAELMRDHPETARKVAKEKICKGMANEMIEQLTWRFV